MRPDNIPQDVWETAQHAARTIPDLDAETKIARVIMAERERCAVIAETPAAWERFPGDFEGNCIAAAIRNGEA